MRRAVLTLGGTLAGLAALLSLKTHPGTSVAGTAPLAPAAPASSAAGGPAASPSPASPSPAFPSGGSSAPASGKAPAAKASASSAAKAGGGTPVSATVRVLTGQVINTQYGPMQVQVTMTGQKITAVKVLQQTDTGAYSQQIDATAIPQLTSETLAAQSARIDAVSGASYTSSGYIQSLQGALDQA
ncbi:MAG TPA: FMN-binding protein [Trebonia sp.]|jgi:uncharacterized protein with FMN-binding domain|nr:FMN-binding protein [Trebonia sp.]